VENRTTDRGEITYSRGRDGGAKRGKGNLSSKKKEGMRKMKGRK